jgi:WD40 repeat protein
MQLLKGPRKAVFRIAFSPDGSLLAAGGWGFLRLWDLSSGKVAHSWALAVWPSAPAFSPDGRLLAVLDREIGYNGPCELLVFRLSDPGQPVFRGPGQVGGDDAGFFAAGARLLAWSFRSALTSWDTATWSSHPLWQDRLDWGDPGYSHIVLAPDGNALFRHGPHKVGNSRPDVLEWHDLSAGKLLRSIRLEGRAARGGVATGDNRLFLMTQQNELVVVDVQEGREVARRKSGRKRFEHVAVTPDGRWAFTAPSGKVIHVWSGPEWHERARLSFGIGEVYCLATAPDGQRAAAGRQQRAGRGLGRRLTLRVARYLPHVAAPGPGWKVGAAIGPVTMPLLLSGWRISSISSFNSSSRAKSASTSFSISSRCVCSRW